MEEPSSTVMLPYLSELQLDNRCETFWAHWIKAKHCCLEIRFAEILTLNIFKRSLLDSLHFLYMWLWRNSYESHELQFSIFSKPIILLPAMLAEFISSIFHLFQHLLQKLKLQYWTFCNYILGELSCVGSYHCKKWGEGGLNAGQTFSLISLQLKGPRA